MKNLPSGLQTLLDTGATTMVHCWKIIRTDGTVQGFTEHDEDINFDGTIYKASSGFSASKIASSLGLAVDNLNADGALSDDTLNEKDLSSGKYDDSAVELYFVNFGNTQQRLLLSKGNLGRVERGEIAFTAELRSRSSRLQQKTGNAFQRTCSASLGDSRCKVNISSFTSSGVITSVEDNRKFQVTQINNDINSFYSLGVLTFISGLNKGLVFEIKIHLQGIIVLWEKPPFEVEVNDGISVIAGCDKEMVTCHNKFNNTINFRGFNLIPGTDFLSKVANRDSSQKGGSLFSSVVDAVFIPPNV